MWEWKSRHHNAGVENAREASVESHTLTTLTTQDERCRNASFCNVMYMYLMSLIN